MTKTRDLAASALYGQSAADARDTTRAHDTEELRHATLERARRRCRRVSEMCMRVVEREDLAGGPDAMGLGNDRGGEDDTSPTA